jgi:hypothetical protein
MKNILYPIILSIVFSLNAQQLAFPTALGDGAYTQGGRGGVVVHVTNLNDSGTGSFREAMRMNVTRTIVFDVSGVVNLLSVLGNVGDNVTIAGQTAPVGGVTIDGERVYIGGVKNIICRYIRFKGGIDGDNDSLTSSDNTRNQIFDHCSFAFGIDESASWYSTRNADICENVTIQRCLFGENAKGSNIGVRADDLNLPSPNTPITASFINNLFYNSGYRFPNVSGREARFDVINNVIWRVSGRLIRGNGDYDLNHIGNYYNYTDVDITDTKINLHRFGYVPQIYTSGNKIVAENIVRPLRSTIAEMNTDNRLSWKFFQDEDFIRAGNFVIGEDYTIPIGSEALDYNPPKADLQGTTNYTLAGASNNNNGTLFVATNAGNGTGIAYNIYYGEQLPFSYFTNTRHALLGKSFTILTADEAFEDVVNSVGCNLRLNADGSTSINLDTLDASWLSNVVNGVYAARLDSSEYIVPIITSVSRDANYDTDNDGMADIWEQATFNDLSKDGTGDLDNDGYTDLEEFLNLVDGNFGAPSVISNNKLKIILISN